MRNARKWRKPALGLLALLLLAQGGAFLLARTRRVHDYLVAQLERSFGRRVEVGRFNAWLFPAPALEAERVTVAEDPAFGNEYFLRADHLNAALRWTGLLRGEFEFGTLSLSHPSLTLVQSAGGNWNLERWLPPAKPAYVAWSLLLYGPQPNAASANHLRKIEIDEGRIDFKSGDEKLPFAFTSVGGSVEQVSPGRWRLQIEAQPWRSGVQLQSAGTLYVRGDIAGTSARLQPAEVHVHWDQGSLADLFRLFRGQDYGVRGSFTLDGSAKSGTPETTAAIHAKPGDWTYSLQARASQIHRWDLTERSDNPGVNINLGGRWNALSRTASMERLVVQTAKSNLRGSMDLARDHFPAWLVRIESAGIQASDVLAWYRAFQPDVDDHVTTDLFATGSATLQGWPLRLQELAFSTQGGELYIPGINSALRISAFSAASEQSRVTAGPIRISYQAATPRERRNDEGRGPARARVLAAESKGSVDLSFAHDFAKQSGSVSLQGRLDKAEDALAFAATFGRVLNHGWELSGPVTGALHRDWDAASPHVSWNGHIEVTNGRLQAAGLNRPLDVNKARLNWTVNARSVDVTNIGAFGASWSGQVSQTITPDEDASSPWQIQLHADHLDATDLDRWAGPRARPGWLQRLIPSLLGRLASNTTASVTPAAELLRRIHAEGDLRVDDFSLEKLHFSQVRANVAVRDLQLDMRSATAQLAGGKASVKLHASFFPRPAYDIAGQVDRIDLSQLPGNGNNSEPFAGQASGSLHLVTGGIGRDELLQNLAGKGEVQLRGIEFTGADIIASVAEGVPRAGTSRWLWGEGAFVVRDAVIRIPGLRLEGPADLTLVKGTVGFDRSTDLSVEIITPDQAENAAYGDRRVLKLSGPIELPRLSVEKLVAHHPAD